jgi:hypothetical protein
MLPWTCTGCLPVSDPTETTHYVCFPPKRPGTNTGGKGLGDVRAQVSRAYVTPVGGWRLETVSRQRSSLWTKWSRVSDGDGTEVENVNKRTRTRRVDEHAHTLVCYKSATNSHILVNTSCLLTNLTITDMMSCLVVIPRHHRYTVTVINLNIDGDPLTSYTHTHPSQSQTPTLSLIHFPVLRYPIPPLHLVCGRISPPPTSVLSLSIHRPPDIYVMVFPLSSRFIRDNKQQFYSSLIDLLPRVYFKRGWRYRWHMETK